MFPKTSPINDLEQLPDHMNSELLVATVKNCVRRLDAIENALELNFDTIRKDKLETLIDNILSNGKIWSFYSVHEEIQLIRPEVSLSTVQNKMSKLSKENKIERVSHGVYRKKA